MSDFFLNPDLNILELRATFQEQGYVLIPNWLKPEVADAIYQAIHNNDFWDVRIFDESGGRIISGQSLKDVGQSPAGFAAHLPQPLLEQAKKGFAYLFYMRELSHFAFPIPQFEEWLKTDFLQFVHVVTGRPLGRLDENLATYYPPGAFLKGHSDSLGNRLLTYISYFTRDWQPDWGGNLHMVLNSTGRMETFVPQINQLLLFDVTTQYHFVSKVAEFATSHRYATTGWIVRPDSPPDENQGYS